MYLHLTSYLVTLVCLLRFLTGDAELSGSSMSLLCKSIKPLEYLTVLTLTTIVAS